MKKLQAPRKSRKKVSDVKMAQANDQQSVETTSLAVVDNETPSTTVGQAPNPAKVVKNEPATAQAKATKQGANFAKLAGSPSKQAVVACFGKSGYSLSWVARAKKLGISTTELCEKFKADAAAVKSSWEAANAKSEKGA